MPAKIGRLVHSADFQRLLATPSWSRSAHFAVHHLPVRPGSAPQAGTGPETTELSTGHVHNPTEAVDDLPAGHWLGAVLPKRLARRAVTRNLLRRQIRAALDRHAGGLPGGLWVVRLRSGFARTEFASAASDALRRAARAELDRALTSPRR
jgi:ribonuclease P protein component